MTIFEYLNLRSDFEDLAVDFKIPGNRKSGTLENLKWFIDNAAPKNRFREGFETALGIATQVVYAEEVRQLQKV